MADLVKHAKRLDSRIKELNTELKKTQGKLSQVTGDKQDRLLKSALAPQGNATGSIDRINQEIAYLKQKIEDVGFVKGKLVEELSSTVEKIREETVSGRQAKVTSLESERQANIEEQKRLRTKIFKLQGKIKRAMLEGEVQPVPPDGYLDNRIYEAQGAVEEAKHLTDQDILRELSIELEEEKEEAIPSVFWKCGQCGLEKSFATENEQATFATRHFEGECELQKTAQKRAKREEVLS